MNYAQFQEDVIVDKLLGSPDYGCVVDIGAGDGDEISNSKLFRLRGWDTVLVESDPRHAAALDQLERDGAVIHRVAATPSNINDLVPADATILSIDIDGDDIFLLEVLHHQPRALIIEHNPTIPRHFDVQPARLGLAVGSSVAALTRVAETLGYGLVAVTHCNVIFLHGAISISISAAVPEYAVATEYFTGRPFVVGTPPWGLDFSNMYPSEDVIVR